MHRPPTLVFGFQDCDSPHSFDLSALADDTYPLEVTQTDLARNTGPTAADAYTLDTTGPAVSITAVPPDPGNDETPIWEFTSEAGSTSECRLMKEEVVVFDWESCDGDHSFDLSSASDGTYRFEVRAQDALSNIGGQAADEYTLDTLAPGLPTIVFGPSATGNDTSPTWAFSGETGASFDCQVSRDGVIICALADCTSPASFDLSSDDTYTFALRAVDPAGNVGPPITQDYLLDTVPPDAPTLTAVPSSPGIDASPEWEFTGEPAATFECRLTQGATVLSDFATCSGPKTYDFSAMQDGSYTFEVGRRISRATWDP